MIFLANVHGMLDDNKITTYLQSNILGMPFLLA